MSLGNRETKHRYTGICERALAETWWINEPPKKLGLYLRLNWQRWYRYGAIDCVESSNFQQIRRQKNIAACPKKSFIFRFEEKLPCTASCITDKPIPAMLTPISNHSEKKTRMGNCGETTIINNGPKRAENKIAALMYKPKFPVFLTLLSLK